MLIRAIQLLASSLTFCLEPAHSIFGSEIHALFVLTR